MNGEQISKGLMTETEYQDALDRLNEAVLAATEQLKAVCREWNANRLAEGSRLCLIDCFNSQGEQVIHVG